MKKLISVFFTCLAVYAYGEGYQVNLQSARQAGMGHTGTGLALGAESMHFNPAGLAYLRGPVDLSAGVSGVAATVKYTDPTDGYTAKTDNPVSTPLYAYAGFRILQDKLVAGVSLTTPYGSTIDWGSDWRGANVVQDISLRAFIIQPTVAVRVVDGLTFGAGLMIGTGSFDLSRAPLPYNLMNLSPDQYPVSLRLKGKAQTVYGYNLGLMYRLCKKWSFGVSYRSKMMAKVDSDDATISYANATAQAALSPMVGPYQNAHFTTELPLPSNFNVGIGYRPSAKWLVAFDLQFVGWKAYKDLAFNFTSPQTNPSVTVKNFRNTVISRLGGQYTFNDWLDLRAGIYFDQSPVPHNLLYPDTPGTNKLGYCAGASFRVLKNLSLDITASYVQGMPITDATCPAPTSVTPTATLSGDYKCHSWTGVFGINCFF